MRGLAIAVGLIGLTLQSLWLFDHVDARRDRSRAEVASRVLTLHGAGCQVEKATGGEGSIIAACTDGRRFRLYAPLGCERDGLLCEVLGVDLACWEVEAD